MDHTGIDVHKRESQIYILAEGGEVIEQRIRTEPERFSAVLGTRPRARILIEASASTESEWVARCLEALGHEVVVADPNFAPMYATRSRAPDLSQVRWMGERDNVAWLLSQGRCEDGAPTPRIPSCAGGLTELALDEREYKADRTSRDRPH